jgi:hypothetical protein
MLAFGCNSLEQRKRLQPPDVGPALSLVHAHQRSQRIVEPFVDLQHLLHVADKGCILLGRNAPHLLAPGLKLVFFIARGTVS